MYPVRGGQERVTIACARNRAPLTKCTLAYLLARRPRLPTDLHRQYFHSVGHKPAPRGPVQAREGGQQRDAEELT